MIKGDPRVCSAFPHALVLGDRQDEWRLEKKWCKEAADDVGNTRNALDEDDVRSKREEGILDSAG